MREKVTVKNYRDLKVWQKAMDLVVASFEMRVHTR
jgi:hypothetical protein